jgi:hypothetical protein
VCIAAGVTALCDNRNRTDGLVCSRAVMIDALLKIHTCLEVAYAINVAVLYFTITKHFSLEIHF